MLTEYDDPSNGQKAEMYQKYQDWDTKYGEPNESKRQKCEQHIKAVKTSEAEYGELRIAKDRNVWIYEMQVMQIKRFFWRGPMKAKGWQRIGHKKCNTHSHMWGLVVYAE
jgi:hypothetical protein